MLIVGMWVIAPLSAFSSQDSSNNIIQGMMSRPFIIHPYEAFLDPFPKHEPLLSIPNDSKARYKGLLKYNYGLQRFDIKLSLNWDSITISETINGNKLKMPYTSTLEWYFNELRKRSWHVRFIDVMQDESKNNTRKARGQMIEVVGMDIGKLGRASLQVSGNVNINGKMVFQDQELVRSTLNETQNTHLEFDQKQNLNIKGKIGDRITVAMDQDSERQFDWENNIRISYEGYEDDIVQKIEAGNISLSLPSTKYVTFSGKNQGLFGVKAISKLGPIDVTTIASIEKSKKEQSEWEGGGQSSTQQIRDVDWIKNRYFFIHPWFRNGVDTLYGSSPITIPSFYPLRNGLHYIGDVVIKNFELYKSINLNDPNAMTGMAYVDPTDTTKFSDENEEGSFIRLEQGANYYMNPDLGFIRVREQVSQDILGCTFTIEHRQTGEVLFEIGNGPDSTGSRLALMMLKPRNSYPNHSTWALMFKNVYYLGTSQINPDGFEVKLINKNSTPVSDRDRSSSLPYITLFGLDSLDENGTRNYDEIIDMDMANIMNMIDGELMFPTFHPFANGDSLTGGQMSEQLKNQLGTGIMYTSSSSSEINGDHRWMIEAAYTNQSATINLGFMLIEGSEEVIQNDITLKRGIDYTIDYFTGTIVLLGDAANDPNAKLKVNYDKHELVSFDKKTIFGTRAQMDLGKPNSFIGATALYFNQSIINQKVEVGYEPTRNFIWDLNGRYEWEMDGVTRFLDKLPLIEAEKISSFSIEGEIAQVLPNPNSISNSETGDANGVAFIDDFEGSKRTTAPSIQRRFWKASSAPLKYNSQDSIFLDPFSQKRRGELYWYNPYVPVRTKDIWPNQSTSLRAGNETTDVLVLRYRAKEYQGYYDPDSVWVGITTSLYSGDYDQIQSKFFEIWLKGNSGKLHIDLGKISEDIDGNGQLNTEDIPGAGLSLGNGFLDDGEDTGLDGCFDQEENGWGGCLESGTYADYYSIGDTTTINLSSDVDQNDPNGDNWDYEPGSLDYSKVNGTESNGTGTKIQEGGKYPDTEDLDRSTFLDKANDYFSSSFLLTDTTYLAGITEKDGAPTGWKLFRIPLSNFVKVQNIEWNEIRYVRLAITGIEEELKTLQIAKMEIVGNEWQEVGIFGPDTSNTNFSGNRSSFSKSSNLGEPQFQVAVINTEDNADYTPPKGVKGEYDRINEIQSKEQSLVLKFSNLPAKHTGIAQKTLYTLNDNQKRSFMTYDYMKMYVNGNSRWTNIQETDVELFLKFGLGDDYYEITQPVYAGWDEEEGRNSFEIDLNWLTALKNSDTTKINKINNNDVIFDSLDVRKYFYTNEVGQLTGNKVVISGKPALNRLQYFSVGLKNTGDAPIDGEVWLDELRLSGVKKESGVAMRVQSNLKLSDLGSATVVYSRQDADYHRLQERLSNSNNTSENLNFSGKIDLHRFLPRSLGISIPVNGTYSQNQSRPKFFSGEDILVNPQNTPDSIMILSNTISLNTSIKKIGKSDNKLLKYTLDNMSLNFSAAQSRSSDVTYNQKWSETYTGKFSYNLAFDRNNYIKPLSWAKAIPIVGKSLSDFQFFYTPTSFKTGMNMNEKLTWNETRTGVKSPETYNFGLARSLNLDYKFTNTLSSKYSWSGQSNLNDYRGYIFSALKQLDPGTVTQMTESFNTTYNPSIMRWLKPSFNYTANFRWSDDLTREGQNISTQLRFGSNFTVTPVQLIELVYKPKTATRARNGNRSRGSRTRGRSKTNTQVKQKENDKVNLNPFNLIHGLLKKINPISISYTETLNRSANQIIGEVPAGYKFGWLPHHGLEQSSEVGSNFGSWDHKRDASLRSGLKLTRSITISTNFTQNFSTTRSSTGLEQLSMTRDYVAYGELFDEGFPFPGWSFRISGLEKWPIIKNFAKSASLEHSFSGKETRSWQFEDDKIHQMNFFNFGAFATQYKNNERSSRLNQNFSPLIGLNFSLDKNISLTFRNNMSKSLDETPSGLTISNDKSYTSTGTYTHRGGMNIPIPFYGTLKLNNTMSFTLNFDLNESREERSGDKINLEVGSFSESWKAGLRVSYQFSTKVSGGIRYEYRESDTRTTGKKIDRDFGFDVNLAISG
ncbi:MAG: cell surface protein SprA [Candidatus Marinimicrobia bacterium]|nr:cell surface protein SprA [Candidatus Neomarinimicrobiota bacterium]